MTKANILRHLVPSLVPEAEIEDVEPGTVLVRLRVEVWDMPWEIRSVGQTASQALRELLPMGVRAVVKVSPCIQHSDCADDADLGRTCRMTITPAFE